MVGLEEERGAVGAGWRDWMRGEMALESLRGDWDGLQWEVGRGGGGGGGGGGADILSVGRVEQREVWRL